MNARYFNLYTGVCLCYLKQLCKSYNNKHNKDVELSDITSAESLDNSQNRYVKGLGSVCDVHVAIVVRY